MSRHPLAVALLTLAACKREPPQPASAPGSAPAPRMAVANTASASALATMTRTTTSARYSLGSVKDYQAAPALATAGEKRVVQLRTYAQNGAELALVVSPEDFSTRVVRRETLTQVAPASWAAIGQALAGTPYLRALSDANQHASALQDAGITHLLPAEHGVVLTVDLCPSRKPIDEILIQSVLSTFTPEEHPVPIALAVTGTWMAKHPADLAQLIALDHKNKLKITWINHSYHHRYDPKLPLVKNFLLENGTVLEEEVLKNEIAMLDAGITPSPFFRFPGLISDAEIVHSVVAYGLIPIGSDAWLAKKEKAKAGDIVLVHGNGNEPAGVNAFLALLAQEKKDIHRRQFLLLDIREGLEDEESVPH
jgi:hypothetical protein